MEMIIPSVQSKCSLTAGAKAFRDRKVSEYDNSVEMKLEVEGISKMKQFKLDIKVGDNVKIIGQEYDSRRKSRKRVIKGTVTFKNKHYITVQGKSYKTSFKLSEFFTGETKLIKEGQAVCN